MASHIISRQKEINLKKIEDNLQQDTSLLRLFKPVEIPRLLIYNRTSWKSKSVLSLRATVKSCLIRSEDLMEFLIKTL